MSGQGNAAMLPHVAHDDDTGSTPPSDAAPQTEPSQDDLAAGSDEPAGAELVSGHAARVAGERLAEAAAREPDVDDDDEPEAHDEQQSHPEDDDPEDPGDVLADCPFCGGGGIVSANKLLEALPNIVATLEPFKQSAQYATCSGCDGWGTVLTGARAGDSAIAPCPDCNGAGYRAADLERDDAPPAPRAAGDEPPPPAPFQTDVMRLPPPRGEAPAIGMQWNPQSGYWEYPAAS